MCTDRHGIFNYLRIQSEFRAPCPALFSFAPFPLFADIYAVFGRFLSFFPSLPPVPPFGLQAPLKKRRLSAFGTFGVIKAHLSPGLCPFVARADAIAPVAQLRRHRTHVRWCASAMPDKKQRSFSLSAGRRRDFLAFSLCLYRRAFSPWHRDRRWKGTRFDFREPRRKTYSHNLTLKRTYFPISPSKSF